MAITLQGSAETTPSGTTTSKGLTLPTHAADDIGIIFFMVDEDTVTHSITVASGWAILTGPFTNTAGRDQSVTVWWKRFSGAGDTNPTCSHSGGNEFMNASVHIFRGVDAVLDPGTASLATNYQNYAGTDLTVPGSVLSSFDNACKVQFQSGSHDDWDSAGTPTGYTLGENYIANQGTTDHQQHVCAFDLNIGVAGSYAWVNFDHPTTGANQDGWNVHLILEEAQPIHLLDVDGDEKLNLGQTGVVVTGDGFETAQGTGGLVELVENADYTGTKVTQTIDTWDDDTEITIDIVQGGLSEGQVFAFVTNDSGDLSNPLPVVLGFGDYDPTSMAEGPDIFWTMDNTYADTGVSSGDVPFDQAQGGTPDFEATPITRSTTHSFRLNSRTDYSESADSQWTNATNQHERRRVGMWIQLQSTQLLPGCVWEEGGGVNNIYFVIAYGSILLANMEDDGDFAIQAYADFPLTIGRPYHILCAFDGSGDGNEFYLMIDGVKQSKTSGNPPDTASQVTHSGNLTFGDSQQNLQTGGQDINYAACDDVLISNWGTWSKIGAGIPSDTEILEDLFENGALANDILAAGTQAAMQTALEAFDSTARQDWPLSYEVPAPSSGGPDLVLTATDQVFDAAISLDIRWLGGGTLTWRNSGTTNASSTHTPNGGAVVFIETAAVSLTVKDLETQTAIRNSRVLLFAAAGGPLPASESVTIVRAGAVATVTHTAHGFTRDDQETLIEDTDQPEYNGVKPLTIVDANTYTYAVSGSPTTPATGSITSTAVIVNALTPSTGIVSGEIDFTTDQPVTGYARKGSGEAVYKESPILATVTASGFTSDVLMVGDEN